MWLSGLHIPESYLTALVQATCRKNGWPLDKSTLYTAVTQVREKGRQRRAVIPLIDYDNCWCYSIMYLISFCMYMRT